MAMAGVLGEVKSNSIWSRLNSWRSRVSHGDAPQTRLRSINGTENMERYPLRPPSGLEECWQAGVGLGVQDDDGPALGHGQPDGPLSTLTSTWR